jgi:hypothetical protein
MNPIAHPSQNLLQNARRHGNPYSAILRPSIFDMIHAASRITHTPTRKVTIPTIALLSSGCRPCSAASEILLAAYPSAKMSAK